MSVAGDSFTQSCRIASIVWEGATTSGDTALLSHRGTADILWPGRTNTTQTYLGISFPRPGLHCPNGFTLSQISAGRLMVYLNEN